MDDIVDFVSRSDDDLRALIAQLEDEEREISRRRRSCTASSTSCAPSS